MNKLLFCFLVLVFTFRITASHGKEDIEPFSKKNADIFKQAFFKKVGLLKIHISMEQGRSEVKTCVATLIAKDYVLTAASCAYTLDGARAANIYFYPGVKEKDKIEYGKYRVTQVYHPKPYYFRQEGVDTSNNIALMKIGPNAEGKAANAIVGTAGYWGKPSFPEGQVVIVGYAGKDKLNLTPVGCQAKANMSVGDVTLDCDIDFEFSTAEGAPILALSENYQQLFIHGVVSGKTNTHFYGSHLSKARRDIVTPLLNGDLNPETFSHEKGNENWISFEPPKNNIVEVRVHNRCSAPINVAANYKDLNGTWRMEGYYKITSDKESVILHSRNGVYYLQVMKGAHTQLLTKKNMTKYFRNANSDIHLQKYQVSEYGSFTHTFNCEREM